MTLLSLSSSVTTLLSASGAWHSERTDFVFVGFLPAKGQEKATRLKELLADPRPQCLLEAPHRIEALARDLAAAGERVPSQTLRGIAEREGLVSLREDGLRLVAEGRTSIAEVLRSTR